MNTKTKIIVALSIVGILATVFCNVKRYAKNELIHSFENKIALESGDLLQVYVEKPPHLKFKILKIEKGQARFNAIYEVAGKHSQSVEDFLVKKYGMGRLKWVCCGYENTNGKHGEITVKQDEENDFTLLLSMYANAEKKDKQNKFYLEFDRNQLTFTVSVKLVFNDAI